MSLEHIMWSPGVTLEAIEKQVILKAYRWYRGNKTQTAIALGISVRTLEMRLEKYGADDKSEQDSNAQDRLERARQLDRARGITRDASAATYAGETSPDATSGVFVQPALESTAKQPLPVSERKEVQEVLHNKVASSDKNRRR